MAPFQLQSTVCFYWHVTAEPQSIAPLDCSGAIDANHDLNLSLFISCTKKNPNISPFPIR